MKNFKHPVPVLPLQHSRPVPCYTDLIGVYIMDDFGNALYVDPKGPLMAQWAMRVVDQCAVEH